MGLKDLREKFHKQDAKVSSLFHKEEDGLKKPSWWKIILTWAGLIIILAIVSSAVTSLFIVEVYEEISPISSSYKLEYSSPQSSIYYISGSSPRQYAYHMSYDGNLRVVLDTSDIPHSDYFAKIMESYLNGNNEYNASVDIDLIAYGAADESIETSLYMNVDDGNLNIILKTIDLLFNNPKFKFKDNILTLTMSGNDKRISNTPLPDSLKNIDHINGVIHVYNKNALETSDPGYYNYTLNFTIPKSSINVKKV